MANNVKKKNNSTKIDNKKVEESTKKKNVEKKVINKNTKKSIKRKSYADEMKMDMSLQTKTTIWTVITVFMVLLTFYVISIYATGGSLIKTKEKDAEVEIQYSEILVGRSFDMGDNYFVVYYDKNDTDNEQTTELTTQINSFKSSVGSISIYTCDLGNSFNKPYVTTEEPNRNPLIAEEMLFNGPTLIRFSEGKVAEFISGYDEVTAYMSQYALENGEE